MSETRTVRDPFLGKDVQVSDRLLDRLRGRYANGPVMPNGEPEFGWREFPSPPIQKEAADLIERCMDMLADVPGATLEDRLTKYIGSYMALQCQVEELRVKLSEAGVPEDDESDIDPSSSMELLRPRGNDGVVDAEICFNAMLLMGDVDISEERVATWSPENLAIAYDWAMRRHLLASDNDDIIVPPRPDFIPRAVFGGF